MYLFLKMTIRAFYLFIRTRFPISNTMSNSRGMACRRTVIYRASKEGRKKKYNCEQKFPKFDIDCFV